jgi:ParB-like chromosome segregation protein Spo0J
MIEIKEEYMNISINEIFIPPDYKRIYIDKEHLNKIALSILENGQIEPIIVIPIEYVKDLEKRYHKINKYKYILIDGLYRIKAFQLLKQEYIKARIRYNDYDIERIISSSKEEKELSIYEKSMEIKRFIDIGYAEEEIFKRLGIDQTYFSNLSRIADANFKEDFKDKEYVLTAFTFRALYYLHTIKLTTPEKIPFIIERAFEEFEKGKRKFTENDIRRWLDLLSKYKNEIKEVVKI